MKRLLSLILALIICLSFIVSCEKEEAPSTSTSSEEPTSTGPDEEVPSATNINSLINEEYTSYSIKLDNTRFLQEIEEDSIEPERKHWIFKSFDEFSKFKEKSTLTKVDEIAESTFEDNIVYAFLYQHKLNNKTKYGNINECANYSFANLRGYIMLAERSVCYPSVNDATSPPYVLDLVLIPKSKVDVDKLAYIDLNYYVHYSYTSANNTGTFVEYIPFTPVLSKEPVAEPSPSEEWANVTGTVTPEYFDAYTNYSATDGYFHMCNDSGTVISSYEELLEHLPDKKKIIDVITNETFVDNFVVLLSVGDYMYENQDIYYTDFKKENGYYTLTQSIISPNFYSPLEYYKGISFCVIPRSECEDDPSTIELKIIEKEYSFLRDKYKSGCMVRTNPSD